MFALVGSSCRKVKAKHSCLGGHPLVHEFARVQGDVAPELGGETVRKEAVGTKTTENIGRRAMMK